MGDNIMTIMNTLDLSNYLNNQDFKDCLLNKLIPDLNNNNEIIEKIGNMENIYELAKQENRNELLYVESRIIDFILLKPVDFSECFENISTLNDDFCSKGLSNDLSVIFGRLIGINGSYSETFKINDNKNTIMNKLLKYIPDIIKKIIDISEYYEGIQCNGEITENTVMLKMLYSKIVKNNSSSDYNYPDMGLSSFINSFQDNILTRSIMLIFIAYVLGKVIGLFNIHYNINK
jgi:hypothetical protein